MADRRVVARKAVRVLLGAVGIYLAAAVALFLLQRRIMYPSYLCQAPEPGGKGVEGLVRIWRPIDEAGDRVEAWLLPGAGADAASPGPLVVFCHGNAELIDDWPDELEPYRQRGFTVLLPEYRGYGRSGGAPGQAAITEDLAWFLGQALARPEVDPDRVVYHGRSLGGGAACALAALRPPRALVLESTFTSMAPMAARFLMPGFLVRDRWDNLAVLRGLACPVLVFHGTRDSTVPFSHAEALRQAASRARLVERDSGHNDLPRDSIYWNAIDRLLAEAGLGRPAPRQDAD